MAKVFFFPANHRFYGKSVLLMNRYKFVDGVLLEEDDDNAKLMQANLAGFYACKSMDFNDFQEKGGLSKVEPSPKQEGEAPKSASGTVAKPAGIPPKPVAPAAAAEKDKSE